MLLIDSETVLQSPAADLRHAARIVSDLFAERRRGGAVSAQEVPMRPRGIESAFYSLPAMIESAGVAGIKWTTHCRVGEPYTKPLVVLNDLKDGTPLALLDGWVISAVRTAAVSLCFYSHLESLAKNAVLLCGAGHQATWQAAALFTRFPDLRVLYLWSRSTAHAKECRKHVEQILGREVPIEVIADRCAVISDVDFVIGATSADDPYLSREDLAHCGYVHIGMNDVAADALLSYPRILCDEFETAKRKSAQSLYRLWRQDPSIEKRVELLENFSGKIASGERFCFDAFGLSIFDVGLAWEAYQYALAEKKGVHWAVFGK